MRRVADEATTPEVGAVDALQALAGKHPGKRANHAKEIMLDAAFTPTARAAQLSKAVLFAGPGKAVVRFSDPLGFPDIPDGDPTPTRTAWRCSSRRRAATTSAW